MKPRAPRILLTGLLLGWLATMVTVPLGSPLAHAVTMYSYIDDQGNPRLTDSLETVPEKYRAKVRTHEQPSPTATPPSTFESLKQAAVEKMQRAGFTLPSLKKGSVPNVGAIQISGISSSQSQILTYAGGAAIVLLIFMYLTKSPMMRLLGLGLLMILAIGTPVLIYVSEDGPADILKRKAISAGQAQRDRLKPDGP